MKVTIRKYSPRLRIRLCLLSWFAIFVIVMAVDLYNPRGWPPVIMALVRLPINVSSAPLSLWTGTYFIWTAGGTAVSALVAIYSCELEPAPRLRRRGVTGIAESQTRMKVTIRKRLEAQGRLHRNLRQRAHRSTAHNLHGWRS